VSAGDAAPGPGGEPDEGAGPLDDAALALDPAADPGAVALGATGDEARVVLHWPALLRHRVQTRAQASDRYPWWVLTALLAGLLSLNITFTVFVVTLKSVAIDLHTNVSVLTWTSTGPLLAFGVAAPLFGRFGDLFGYRRLYLFGLFGAMCSAALTALAPNVAVLLFARALDGVQGAATGTASMAIILRLFAPEERVKALGWWSMVGAGGPVIGVSIGSVVIGALGWRDLFWGQLILLVCSTAVVALILPAHGRHALPSVGADDPPPRWQGIDWAGAWSLSGAVTGLMLAISIGPLDGWSSPWVSASAVFGVVCIGVFIWRERTAARPIIPVKYFKRRNFVLPMGTRACTNFAYFGGFFLFPLLMETVSGYSVQSAGLISIARPLVFAVSAPISGYVTIRVGERRSAAFGALCVTASMILFALLGASPAVLAVILALSLSGLGMGVATPATSSTQANEVDPSEFGVMSAAQLLATQVGEVIGIQVSVTVLESHARRHGVSLSHGTALLGSFRVAFFLGAAVAMVGVVCALFIRDFQRPEAAAPDRPGASPPAPRAVGLVDH
jgi:MFS family permease